MKCSPGTQAENRKARNAASWKSWFAKNRDVYNERRRIEAQDKRARKAQQQQQQQKCPKLERPVFPTVMSLPVASANELYWTRTYVLTPAASVQHQTDLQQAWRQISQSIHLHYVLNGGGCSL